MKLAILNGPLKREQVLLTRQVAVVGKSDRVDLQLVGDPEVAAEHCRLFLTSTGWQIEDLEGSSGTQVNGVRVSRPTPVPVGTVIQVGDTRFALLDDDMPAPLDDGATGPPAPVDEPVGMTVAGTLDPRSLTIEERAPDPAELASLRSQLQVFQGVAAALVGKLDIDDVLRTICRFVLNVVPASGAVALRRRRGSANWSPVAACAADGDCTEDIHVSHTLVARAARDKLAVLVKDTMEDGELAVQGSIRLGMIRSSICVPLLYHDEVKAVIQLNANAAYSLGDDDLRLVTAVANQAALALANSELYRELREAKGRLVRAEKLATLGQLAESIAHDIGNVITPIAGFSIQLRKNPDIKQELKDAFDRGVRRLGSLTRQLLALGRPKTGAVALASIDINETVSASAALLETEARHHGVKLCTQLDPDLPPVHADPDRLDQVFVNLSINAIHAMAKDGGTLTVRTFQEGGQVVIEFADTGIGIPPENLERIFDAFFTTKGSQGTGLGLHSCQRIVEEEHDGKLSVSSEIGVGTKFSVRLPLGPR